MNNILARVYDTLFHVCKKRDLHKWDITPQSDKNIYGVYHVYCDTGWEKLVVKQIESLKSSGLFMSVASLAMTVMLINLKRLLIVIN